MNLDYEIIPSAFFLSQLDGLSIKSLRIVEEKILLLKKNPFRFKRIKGYSLFLFRIRFEDNRKEKRIIYLVDKSKVKILCILDRDNNYKDLNFFIKKYI